LGAASGQGIVEGDKADPGKKEAVEAAGIGVDAGGIVVCSDDLAEIVYCLCAGDAPVWPGFIDGGEDAAAQEKAVRAAGVGVIPDDLACIISALSPRHRRSATTVRRPER
jgi:hypothetical protein